MGPVHDMIRIVFWWGGEIAREREVRKKNVRKLKRKERCKELSKEGRKEARMWTGSKQAMEKVGGNQRREQQESKQMNK